MESILVNIVFGCILGMGKVVNDGINKKWCGSGVVEVGLGRKRV